MESSGSLDASFARMGAYQPEGAERTIDETALLSYLDWQEAGSFLRVRRTNAL